MKFSLLMSIYYKEKSEYFDRAMQSIWDEQNLKPNEIILVEDGKLTDDLYKIIEKWKIILGNILKIVPLGQNVGLGNALNIGLKECSYDLVARMDTDDICMPDRFEKQIKIFKNSDINICSSWVSEFEENEYIIISYRKIPEQHQDILKYSKIRNPLNHPAVMYQKSAVEKAGSYKNMMLFEDYYLWMRMILKDMKFYNIQEPLVKMRAGYSQLERRSGFMYGRHEIKFLYEIYKLDLISSYQFFFNLLLKIPIRLLPKNIIRFIYKILRKSFF